MVLMSLTALVTACCALSAPLSSQLVLHSDFSSFSCHISWITYALVHSSVGHLAFNLLALWLFGIVLIKLSNRIVLLAAYFAGALAGAAGFIFASYIFDRLDLALCGASSAVLAVAGAVCILSGKRRISEFFNIDVINSRFNFVKNLNLPICVVMFLSVILIANPVPVVAITHLSGFVAGCICGWFVSIVLFPKSKSSRRRCHSDSVMVNNVESNAPDGMSADIVSQSEILDKLRFSGYACLSPEERRRINNKQK